MSPDRGKTIADKTEHLGTAQDIEQSTCGEARRRRRIVAVAIVTASRVRPWRNNSIAEVSLDLAFEFDRQGIAFSIARFANRHANPSLADAVFLNIVAFLAIQSNANATLENLSIVKFAFRVSAKAVGECWRVVIGHKYSLSGLRCDCPPEAGRAIKP